MAGNAPERPIHQECSDGEPIQSSRRIHGTLIGVSPGGLAMAASTLTNAMNPIHRILYLAVVYGFLSLTGLVFGDDAAAPYFMIPGSSAETAAEQLPLKSTAAEVRIDGTIARVKLIQRYGNAGIKPIEAVYVFPASTRAAVHGMTLTHGGKVITARIRESVKAKAEYEKAKQEKKTAALLEEMRPNVFQMSVANLMPGDDVKVEIEWTETVPATGAVYEYVLPTVVGPRYTGGSGGGKGAGWAANPHLPQGVDSPTEFSLGLSLDTTLPLAECVCPSHPVKVEFQARDRATLVLDHRHGKDIANRDFILRWKLGNDAVDAGLLLHRGEKKNHFLLQVAPPERVPLEQVPGRDYVMVLDISGSMRGFPVDTAKQLLTDLIGGLRPDDTFNVLTFASGSAVLSESPLDATPENIAAALKFIDRDHAGGGTELEAALRRALALPGGEGRSRSILLVTDGYITAEEECRELVRENIGQANLFAFGIGSAVNRQLIELVARAGGGEPVVVTNSDDATAAVRRFREEVSNPVLAKVRIEAEGVELGGIEPSPHPDVFASRPLVITGTWSGEPRGKIVVRGIAGGGKAFEKTIDLAEAAEAKGVDHPALPVLWARERVRRLTDLPTDADVVGEITALGLEHALLTPYTSFVAVDETPREMDGLAETVRQPLPLPQGVSNAAVGGSAPMVKNASVPEPGAIGLIALLATLLAAQRRRD
jgi:Ca-activated chloride channel family protein